MAKIGEGSFESSVRLGLAEMRNAFNPSRESISATPDQGMYGTATQGEIANARDGAGDGPEQETTMDSLRAEAQGKQQDDKDGPGKDGPDQGMER